uniref:E3 ubiquitin-protein ligase n=1 Tax=Heterorhabditis bacteriophora TaxID=37862 RepID=A0A1I7XNB7_HETBA
MEVVFINGLNTTSIHKTMIVDLVSAVQQSDWERARQLLYQHWVSECPKLYAANSEHPWETSHDESAISIANHLFVVLNALLFLLRRCTHHPARVIVTVVILMHGQVSTLANYTLRMILVTTVLGEVIGDILLTCYADDELTDEEDMEVEDREKVKETLLVRLLRWDKKMWKGHYEEIYSEFIDDDHDVDVSVVSLTVQFLTVSSIARRLIAEDNAMGKMFNALMTHTDKYVKEPSDPVSRFDFTTRSFPVVVKRAMHMMRDVVYILTSIPQPTDWSDQLREQFLRGCKAFISFLHRMQGMDEVKRQSVEHQVWELEWETAFNIQLRMQEILSLVTAWAATDMCLDALAMHPPTTSDENNGETHCIVHGLLNHSYKYFVYNLLYATLFLYRVLVLCAQTSAQLWRRNGFSLVNQIHNYYSPLCRTEMFDRDLLMMQIGAALSPPTDFILHLMCRYRVTQWAELSFDGSDRQGTPFGKMEPEETSKIIVTLAEEMLHILILIIGERFRPGVGKCSSAKHINREVLHILCTGPQPFSHIQKRISHDPMLEKLSLHDAVNTVAEFRKPTSTSAGQFHLKESLLHHYNPFFYHYSKSDLSQAEQYQQKIRAKAERKIIACPPPVSCEFEPFFAPIRNLLKTPSMIKMTRAVLERTSRRNRFSSDRLLHRALYLIGMALNEQAVDPRCFDYTTFADKEDIFKLMETLAGSSEVSTHSDLLWWTIQKYKEVERISKSGNSEENEGETEIKGEHVDEARNKRATIAAKMRAQAMQKVRDLASINLQIGIDASTCSHTMHYECYMNLSDTLLNRERQRPRQQLVINQKMVDPEVIMCFIYIDLMFYTFLLISDVDDVDGQQAVEFLENLAAMLGERDTETKNDVSLLVFTIIKFVLTHSCYLGKRDNIKNFSLFAIILLYPFKIVIL